MIRQVNATNGPRGFLARAVRVMPAGAVRTDLGPVRVVPSLQPMNKSKIGGEGGVRTGC